jgi:hypothetical protein
MSRSGPAFPVWAFTGFWLGALCGGGLGYLISIATDGWSGLVSPLAAGGGAAGGAVVGAVRDILAYLDRRFPSNDGPESDYRDEPFRGLPPAPPLR